MKLGVQPFLILTLSLGFVVACGTKDLTKADLERVNNGMSFSEVKAILGSPHLASKDQTTFLWTTKDKTQGIYVNFDAAKGKVSGIIILEDEPVLKRAMDSLARQ
ncbi:MAG: outer membrane protein assembly factor BamE [Acidobacteriota bacterium]